MDNGTIATSTSLTEQVSPPPLSVRRYRLGKGTGSRCAKNREAGEGEEDAEHRKVRSGPCYVPLTLGLLETPIEQNGEKSKTTEKFTPRHGYATS